jgi:hypothetical protein
MGKKLTFLWFLRQKTFVTAALLYISTEEPFYPGLEVDCSGKINPNPIFHSEMSLFLSAQSGGMPVAKFLVHHWGQHEVDFGIGCSYRPASLYVA